MKVLFINVCCNGSTGNIVQKLANEYKKNGHEVVIAYGRGDNPNGIKSYKIENKLGIYVHVLLTRLFDMHAFCSTHSTKKFIKWIKSYNPDLIWLHNLHGYYINVKILFEYLNSSKKQIMWTLHDCWAFTGHCAHFDFENCYKWQSMCYKCQNKRAYPKCKLFSAAQKNYIKKRMLFTSIDRDKMKLIVPSTWLRNLVKKSYLKKYDIKIINNGIDLNVFYPMKSSFKETNNIINKKILLGVAFNWSYKKGLDIMINLSQLIDNKKYQIVLVGTNGSIDKMLPSSIISIHKTNNQMELAEIYSSAYVLINPTREDVLGMVNIEANACGTPVITFNTGGSPECITNKSGIVTKEKTAQSILEELDNIEKINRDDCVEAAKRFDMNEKFNEYIKLYKEVMEKN